MLSVEWRAMGSQIQILAESESKVAQQLLSTTSLWFEKWEQSLSRFRPESELTALNARAGNWVAVSQWLWEVMATALRAAKETNGLVTPLILPALESAGYVSSFDPRHLPDGPWLELSGPIANWRGIQMRRKDRAIFLPLGSRIDLGGFGKGWAVHRAMKRLSRLGDVLVNAGGDIELIRRPTSRAPWEVRVANPAHPGDFLGQALVYSGGIATSGRDYRRWRKDGTYVHHLIDPRTGIPSETDLLSTTVFARNVMEAEKAAKMALLLGSCDGKAWIERRKNLAGIFFREDGRILYSAHFQTYMRERSFKWKS